MCAFSNNIWSSFKWWWIRHYQILQLYSGLFVSEKQRKNFYKNILIIGSYISTPLQHDWCLPHILEGFGICFWCLWILTTNMPTFVSSWLDYYCYIYTHFEQSKAAVAIETAVQKLGNPISMHNFLLFVFISLATSLKIVIKMHAIGGKKWGCF